MGVLKIVECKGYTKEEAFAHLHFDPNSPVIPGVNATQAWHKAGSPIVGSQAFKQFITQQLEWKTKNKPGYGIHIVLSPSKRDIRNRPYTIINNKTEGTREWQFVYQIREDVLDINWEVEPEYDDDGEMIPGTGEGAEISVMETGRIVDVCASKADACKRVKELITATHKCYSILPVKVPNIAPIAAFGIYTPSSNAKEGTFIACGIDKEDDK